MMSTQSTREYQLNIGQAVNKWDLMMAVFEGKALELEYDGGPETAKLLGIPHAGTISIADPGVTPLDGQRQAYKIVGLAKIGACEAEVTAHVRTDRTEGRIRFSVPVNIPTEDPNFGKPEPLFSTLERVEATRPYVECAEPTLPGNMGGYGGVLRQ